VSRAYNSILIDKNTYRPLFFIFVCIGIICLPFLGHAQVNPLSNVHTKTHAAAHEQKKSKQDSIQTNSKGAIIPVPFIITDKNLGYGGILALSYIHANKNTTRKDAPPNVTAIAGGGTTTKTWAIAALHFHSFKNDDIRYLGGLAYMDANLDFYQLGGIDLSNRPIEVNNKGWGTLQLVKFRIGNSNFFIGPQYGFLSVSTGLNLDGDSSHPKLEPIIHYLDSVRSQTYLSAIGLNADFDSRDNTMSPKKGLYSGFELSYNATWLGASQNFLQLDLFFYGYVPLTKWLYSIYHFDAQFTGGDVPFYMRPFVELRGAPIMRYQGNQTMLGEVQFRGYFTKSLALVAFTGAGKAYDSFSEFGTSQWIVNYGTGFRWEMEKAFGIRIGADFAWTNNNDFGWYIVIGTGL
jgi:hypothetical protein